MDIPQTRSAFFHIPYESNPATHDHLATLTEPGVCSDDLLSLLIRRRDLLLRLFLVVAKREGKVNLCSAPITVRAGLRRDRKVMTVNGSTQCALFKC